MKSPYLPRSRPSTELALFGRQAGPRDARRVEMATGPFAEDDGPVVRELSEARPLGQRARGRGGKGSLRLSHSPASLAIVARKDAAFCKIL